MFSCRALIDLIADYLDGRLDEVACAGFEHHLSRCRSCQAYLNSYRTTLILIRKLG